MGTPSFFSALKFFLVYRSEGELLLDAPRVTPFEAFYSPRPLSHFIIFFPFAFLPPPLGDYRPSWLILCDFSPRILQFFGLTSPKSYFFFRFFFSSILRSTTPPLPPLGLFDRSFLLFGQCRFVLSVFLALFAPPGGGRQVFSHVPASLSPVPVCKVSAGGSHIFLSCVRAIF